MEDSHGVSFRYPTRHNCAMCRNTFHHLSYHTLLGMSIHVYNKEIGIESNIAAQMHPFFLKTTTETIVDLQEQLKMLAAIFLASQGNACLESQHRKVKPSQARMMQLRDCREEAKSILSSIIDAGTIDYAKQAVMQFEIFEDLTFVEEEYWNVERHGEKPDRPAVEEEFMGQVKKGWFLESKRLSIGPGDRARTFPPAVGHWNDKSAKQNKQAVVHTQTYDLTKSTVANMPNEPTNNGLGRRPIVDRQTDLKAPASVARHVAAAAMIEGSDENTFAPHGKDNKIQSEGELL